MLIAWLIAVVVSGLVVGGLGRLALPGPDPMGVPQTILLGIGGSFIGGLLSFLLPGDSRGLSGLIFGVIGAVVLLLIVRRTRRPA